MARIRFVIITVSIWASASGFLAAESAPIGSKAARRAAWERRAATGADEAPALDAADAGLSAYAGGPPANDNCANAAVINTATFDSPVVVIDHATVEDCEVMENGGCLEFPVGVSNSIWYRFTAPSPGLLDLSTTATPPVDTVLSVWDGCAAGPPCDEQSEPSELACNDDDGQALTSRIDDFQVMSGTTYWIKISDFDTDPINGSVQLHFRFQADAPIASIISPAAFQCACLSNAVIGTATAAGGFQGWSLEYKSTSGSLWTQFASAQTPAVNQQLGTWNTGSLNEGHYYLRLVSTNQAGASESDVVVVYADKQFATADIQEPPVGGVVGGVACVQGAAFDELCFDNYAVTFREIGGSFALVDPGQPQYEAPVHAGPLVPGGWDTTGLQDGGYELRLTGRTVCNQSATETVPFVIDNTSPVALLTEPSACASYSDVIHIRGTATDANLAGWELQYTGGDNSDWVPIASGTTQQNDSVLAMWDVSKLPACSYTLRLLVEDAAVVDCRGPHISEYLVNINIGDVCPLDLDGDGDQDLSEYSIFQNCHTGPLP